jgi:hypothetical protein
MAIYELNETSIRKIEEATFSSLGVKERYDLQRLLRDHISVISPKNRPEILVIAEEFGEWEEANRRIDLLGIDKQGNVVVIELKRTETGGRMELQALRYAAMISTLTFERTVDLFAEYLTKRNLKGDAETLLREFLEIDEDEDIEDEFAQDVRIVLAAAEFSKELTTCVLWLNERDLDITCVRLKPYRDGDRVLLDVQQVIPLPEAREYQIGVREKSQKQRESRKSNDPLTKFDVTVRGKTYPGLIKCQAAFEVVRGVIESGVCPKEIMGAVTFRKANSFRMVDGANLTRDEFVGLAGRQAEGFDASRFFLEPGELFTSNGKTFAFSNRWGSRCERWMNQVVTAFPQAGVSVVRSGTAPPGGTAAES